MIGVRSLVVGALRGRTSLRTMQAPMPPLRVQKRLSHDEHGPPQPFDNMPFNVSSRYCATLVFGIFFGTGLWAPFFILWYSLAKSSL